MLGTDPDRQPAGVCGTDRKAPHRLPQTHAPSLLSHVLHEQLRQPHRLRVHVQKLQGQLQGGDIFVPQAEWATEEVPETHPDRRRREEGQNVRQRKQTGHRQYADDKYDVIDGSQLQKSKLI